MESVLDFIRSVIPSEFLRAQVLATARHLATWSSGLIIAWLVAHHASTDDAAKIAEGVSAIILGLASYGFSLWDVKKVDDKVKLTQATTAIQTASAVKASPTAAKKIVTAATSGTPEALSSLLTQLNK